MKKILILADSLSLPRGERQGNVTYEETYPFLLDKNLRSKMGPSSPVIIEKGMRARTVIDVIKDWNEHVVLKKPDVLIIHVGIVDCAPRVFSKFQRKIVFKIKPTFVKNIILKLVKKYRKQIIKYKPKTVYTPINIFEKSILEIIRLAKTSNVKQVFFVDILSPPRWLEDRSPGFCSNVVSYNDILRSNQDGKLVKVINLNDEIVKMGGSDKMTVDGIHLNSEGHKILCEMLTKDIYKKYMVEGR